MKDGSYPAHSVDKKKLTIGGRLRWLNSTSILDDTMDNYWSIIYVNSFWTNTSDVEVIKL